MLERMLSTWGFRIYFAIALALMGYIGWGTFTNTGVPGWLNGVQAEIFGGSYYPKLTFVLLMFPALAIAFPVGFLFDYVTRQGKFEDDIQPPPQGRNEKF